ncbi:Pleiotropic drug resistance protein 2 [Camellia lanceoleosa]|uniref:Pleiotropic drug resistance protein 2 n=1 Tax=Camellia lanceoleosa TaxID=1840588 RepID=A0ACC0GRA6_9ERIC|nr:Pleiotropic drug resistance protein 2 [Camellia lanceoleosa]
MISSSKCSICMLYFDIVILGFGFGLSMVLLGLLSVWNISFLGYLARGIIGMVGLSRSKKRVIKILHDGDGIIKPSRLMTLLLGPPGSGKTTLLKALAGKFDDNLKAMARNLGFLVLILSVIFVCEAMIFHPISESH